MRSGVIFRKSFESINNVLHPIGFALVMEVDCTGGLKEPTMLALEWRGLPWSKRRRAWDARWFKA